MSFTLTQEKQKSNMIMPKGEYHAFISNTTIQTNAQGVEMAVIEITIRKDIHPEYAGRVIKYADRIVNKPSILWKLTQAHVAAGLDTAITYEDFADAVAALRNKDVIVTLGINEFNDKTNNIIEAYKPFASDATNTESATETETYVLDDSAEDEDF